MMARTSVSPLATMLYGLVTLAACTTEPDQAPPQQPAPPAEIPAGEVPMGRAPFATALWPGEGIPAFAAATTHLPLRSAPYPDAATHDTLIVTAGVTISYDSTHVRTVSAAPITVLRADTIAGRDFGAVIFISRGEYGSDVARGQFPVTPASRLELLQYRSEGTCFVRLDTRVIEADPCPQFDTGAFRPSGTPVTEWWIFATGGAHGGGWVLVSDNTVKVAGRRF